MSTTPAWLPKKYSTGYFIPMVTHPDINPVQQGLTSVNRREPVFPFGDNRTWSYRSSQLWTQFKQLRLEASKSQDFKGAWTDDLAIPVRRSNHRRTGVARSRVQTPLKFWLFQASIRNCLNCVHNCDDHSLLYFKIRSSIYGTFHISLHIY